MHNNKQQKTPLTFTNIKHCLLILSATVFSMSNSSSAEIPSQAFSGLNHFIPVHARLPLYKLKAQKSRARAHGSDLAKGPPWGGSQTHGYSGAPNLNAGNTNCSLNIGNIVPGDTAASYGSKETIVLIEGDVINAADCTR